MKISAFPENLIKISSMKCKSITTWVLYTVFLLYFISKWILIVSRSFYFILFIYFWTVHDFALSNPLFPVIDKKMRGRISVRALFCHSPYTISPAKYNKMPECHPSPSPPLWPAYHSLPPLFRYIVVCLLVVISCQYYLTSVINQA